LQKKKKKKKKKKINKPLQKDMSSQYSSF